MGGWAWHGEGYRGFGAYGKGHLLAWMPAVYQLQFFLLEAVLQVARECAAPCPHCSVESLTRSQEFRTHPSGEGLVRNPMAFLCSWTRKTLLKTKRTLKATCLGPLVWPSVEPTSA